MSSVRRRLSWFTVCWLGCQLAGFVAAPVVLGATSTIVANDLACDCPPGAAPGQTCPMHKGHEESPRDETNCQVRNDCTPSDAALLALTGSIALLPASSCVEVDLAPAVIARLVLNPIARAELPEAPPPRA